MRRGTKIALGGAALAAAGVGGYVVYEHYRAKIPQSSTPSQGGSTSSTGGSSGTGSGGSSVDNQPEFGFGTPYVSLVRIRPRRRGGLFLRVAGAMLANTQDGPQQQGTAVGGVALPTVVGFMGQTLHVPVTVSNHGSTDLTCALLGWMWEDTGSGFNWPFLGAHDFAGHLVQTPGQTGAVVFTVSPTASGQSGYQTGLVSESPLGGSGTIPAAPIGVYLHLHVYTDASMSAEQPGSPLALWSSNAFLTVTTLSHEIGFGFGTPSASLAAVGARR